MARLEERLTNEFQGDHMSPIQQLAKLLEAISFREKVKR